jgi:tetratricopeptide (TPR) repeat protein
MKPYNKNISPQDISRYLKGDMNKEEVLLFEKIIDADPFLKDAIDGYKTTGSLPEDLRILDFKKRSEKQNNKIRRNIISIAAIITFFIISLSLLHFYLNPKPKTNHNISIHQFHNLNGRNYSLNNNIDSLKENNVPKTYLSENLTLPAQDIDIEMIKPMNVKHELSIENKTSQCSDLSYYYSSNHLYTYINDFKVVDYRFENRSNQKNYTIPTNRFEEFSNKTNLNAENLRNKTSSNYITFLNQALLKYQNKDFYEAIADFEIILNQYPDDINALFYMGMSYFELNMNNEALAMIKRVSDNEINTFKEEADWYTSLIYREEKQYAQAESLLNEIVNNNGYYGAQAARELSKLNME